MMGQIEKRLKKFVSDEVCLLNSQSKNEDDALLLGHLLDKLFDDLTKLYMSSETPLSAQCLDSYLRHHSTVDSEHIKCKIAKLVIKVIQMGAIVVNQITFNNLSQYVLPYWYNCIIRTVQSEGLSRIPLSLSRQANQVFNCLCQYRPLDAALITSHASALTLADFSTNARDLLHSHNVHNSDEAIVGSVLSYRFSPCEDLVLSVHCIFGLELFSATACRLRGVIESGLTGRLTLSKLSATEDSLGIRVLDSLHVKLNSNGTSSVRIGLAGPEIHLDCVDQEEWAFWLYSNLLKSSLEVREPSHE
ncbi:hypothetical protein AB6D11_00235 [Vibrio splendidus]